MNLLSDIITYVRRIVKSPSGAVLTDDLIIDYINRFWIMDMDARVQLFDLKTKYQFQTVPGVDRYNMPLYSVQPEPGSQTIAMYPVYQGFLEPAFILGVQVAFYTLRAPFFNIYPNVTQQMQIVAVGDGTAGPYQLNFPISPSNASPLNPPVTAILRGHVDMAGIVSTGNNIDPPVVSPSVVDTAINNMPVTSVSSSVYITSIGSDGSSIVVADSGQFLQGNVNYGLLMQPGPAPFGNVALPGGYSTTANTVNYLNGTANVEFPVAIPAGANINVQCLYFQTGLPRGILFHNNTITLRSPPDTQYLVELDAYLSPAAFLTSGQATPFAYMSEYIARGAARKILSDTGDLDQFAFYELLFKEQETLVWKRSQRQFTSTRTPSLYSQGLGHGNQGNNFGGSSL